VVVVVTAPGYDSIDPFARPEVAVVSVHPAAAAAVVVVVVVVVVVAAAVVLDRWIESEVGSAMAKKRVSLLERHDMVQRSVFGLVADTRTPTPMETDRNVVMDTTSVDATDYCSAATSLAERIEDMAVMAWTVPSFDDPDV